MFSNEYRTKIVLDKIEEWASMDKDSAKVAFVDYISSLDPSNYFATIFMYAYGAAFSPNKENSPPYTDFPFYNSGDEILCDSALLVNYENSFGGLDWKVNFYKANLLQLKGILIDYGVNDHYSWIPRGCIYYSNLLTEAGIQNELLSFNGGHSNQVKERIENVMLPYFTGKLEFETAIQSKQTI
ncbi:MAG: hypothetical protein PVH88_23650 [Ignavibacteria bacterium]|jgi:hypothetical protein